MSNKVLLILFSIFFLFGCSSKLSSEDGWELIDEDLDLYIKQERYSQDSSNTEEFLSAHEGTWVSDKDDDVVVIFEEDQIHIGLNTGLQVLPVSFYSLETKEYASKSDDYEPTDPIYGLNLGVPPYFNNHIKQIKVYSPTIHLNRIKSSNYSLNLEIRDEGNYAFYNLKQSDKEYIKSLDPVIQESTQTNKSVPEVSDGTSRIEPYVKLKENKYYLDEKGNLIISGYYRNVNLYHVDWYMEDQSLGVAEEGTSNIRFILPIVYEGTPVTKVESVTLKAIDRTNEEVVYVNEKITIDTSNFIPETKENEISEKNEHENSNETGIDNTENDEQKDSESNNTDSLENNETDDTELNEHDDLGNNGSINSEYDKDIEKAINILSEYFAETMDISYSEEKFEVVPTSSDFSSIVVYPEFAKTEPSKEWLEIRRSLLSASVRISKETSLHTPHILFVLDITSLLLIELNDGEIIFDATIE